MNNIETQGHLYKSFLISWFIKYEHLTQMAIIN
jgi:hypothetical protein